MIKFIKMLAVMSAFFICGNVQSQGIIVNEFSNGDSGTKEFMEFLVVGDPCTTVDIRGWIFDDNNGPNDATCEGFTDNTGDASGIAGGHNRFAYIARWAAVPVGSLILIYKNGDKNTAITLADDPTDANNDFVYVLPISDSGLEGNGTVPVNGGSCGYSGGSYGAASWNYIGLRNSGDACQTRMPDGTYFHGFAYGTNLTGGPDNLYFSGSGTGHNYYLNCGHHSFITDYSMGDADTSDETPGEANNPLNQNIVDYYRGVDGCGVKESCVTVLDSDLLYFNGKEYGDYNLIKVMADSYDILEHSVDGVDWTYLTTTTQGLSEYKHVYVNNVINYYRIFDKTIAIDNTKTYNYIYVNVLGVMVDENADGLKIRLNLQTGEKKLVR